MIMRTSRQASYALLGAFVLASLAGCEHLKPAEASDFSTPLCVAVDDHALRVPTVVGTAEGSSEWMLTDFRHVDAYQQYRQVFDQGGTKGGPSAGSAAAASSPRGASFSCHRHAASSGDISAR